MVATPGTRSGRLWLRQLSSMAVALTTIAGLALVLREEPPQNPNGQAPLLNLPAPQDIQAITDYRDRAERICTAAHARLHEELQASGVEVHSDHPSILKAEQRIMGEILIELRAVRPPVEVRRHFDHLYGLMERFANGEEMPYISDAEFWVHQVTGEPSLSECTLDLPG